MDWYKVEENDAYKRITGKLFIVATKHKVLGGTEYLIAKPVFRWKDWWWHDINDNSFMYVHEDDRYTIFSPISF
mgnify:FL=1